MAEVKRVFDRLDKDGTGSITKTEIGIMFAQIGMKLSPGELEEAFALLDEDKDGVINFTGEVFVPLLSFCFNLEFTKAYNEYSLKNGEIGI